LIFSISSSSYFVLRLDKSISTKSEVVVLGYPPEIQHHIANSLNYRLSTFHVNYLGMVEEISCPFGGASEIEDGLLCGRFTSKGSKRVLIDYYLSSLPMYTVIL
jgi:hypothetical protein